MPKREATAELLSTVGEQVYAGELKTLHIRRYKSGKNTGKLFVEYTLKDGPVTFDNSTLQQRAKVASLIQRAARAMEQGADIDLKILKQSPIEENYLRMLVIKGGPSS